MKLNSKYSNICVLYGCGNEGDELGNNLSTHFLLLPTMKALERIFGDKMILVGQKSVAESVFSSVRFKKIVDLGFCVKSGVKRFDLDGILKEVPSPDLFICLNSWMGPDNEDLRILHDRLCPVESLGFYNYFSARIAYNLDLHFCDLMFQFATHFQPELTITDFLAVPEIPEKSRKLVGPLLEGARRRNSRILVTIPDCTCSRKELCSEAYVPAFTKLLDGAIDLLIVILSSHFNPSFESRYSSSILVLDNSSFEISWAFVAQADYFLGPDSDFLHIADIYRVPSVGLFGPLSPYSLCGFRFAENQSISSEDYHMRDITTEQISNAFETVTCSHYRKVD